MQIVPPSIVVRDTGTEKGLGVFATQIFQAGEIIEVCPVVVFCMPFHAIPQQIKTRLFNWSLLANTVAETYALALGYGSMYNHDNPANARYEAGAYQLLLRFIANRDITPGEELTINYNQPDGISGPDDDDWFANMNLTPLTNI